MEKLAVSYQTLLYLGSQIFFFKEVHETFMRHEELITKIPFEGHYANIPLARAISGNHLNYLILVGCAYLDEYNEEFVSIKHPEYAQRISALKKLTMPITKRITKWTNLKDYRNYLLAHNLRVKGKSIFANDFVHKHFKVPHTNSEVMLFAELLRLINVVIAIEFPELVADTLNMQPPLSKISFDWIEVDIHKELIGIRNQIGIAEIEIGN